MALRAQGRKPLSGPSPEVLLSQLSGYNRAEAHGVEGGRSEANRILGKSYWDWNICLFIVVNLKYSDLNIMVAVEWWGTF